MCSCLMARSHNGLGLDFVDGGKLDLLLLKHIVHEQVTTTSTNTTTRGYYHGGLHRGLLTPHRPQRQKKVEGSITQSTVLQSYSWKVVIVVAEVMGCPLRNAPFGHQPSKGRARTLLFFQCFRRCSS